jgi:hypothetical protein
MTNIELIQNLRDFYELCARAGWSNVKRYDPELIQIQAPARGGMGKPGLYHFLKALPLNLKTYHWIDPKTASILVKKTEEILKVKDEYYINLRPNRSGTKYMVEAMNIDGKIEKKWTLKLFFFPPIHVLILSMLDQFIKKWKEKREKEVLRNG